MIALKLVEAGIDNVYWLFKNKKRKVLVTKNLTPGFSVYGEKLYRIKGVEYRQWIPNRSKLAASIYKKIEKVPIKEGYKVLYLGAASGTTISHVSDIIWEEGITYGVDIAPRVVRDLVFVAKRKRNIVPILADASKIELYSFIVPKVDFVYQDIAAPNQVDIFIKNVDYFLKNGKYGMIAIKARSIDVSRPPAEIFKESEKILKEHGYEIVDKKRLEPFHKDHIMILIRK